LSNQSFSQIVLRFFVHLFDENKYPPFGYHEFEQSEIRNRRLLILYSAKTISIFTKTQSSHHLQPQQQGQKTNPPHPLAHHYTPGPADAAQWTPDSNRQPLPLALAQ